VIFTYDARTLNPDDLAQKLVDQFNLTTWPTIDVLNATQIQIIHPQATEQVRTQIQTLINNYVFDPVRTAFGAGAQGAILAKLQKAQTTNATFLALGTAATAAQVRDQVMALTRQMNGAIKLTLNQFDDLSGT
jgi:hypothetical protein